MRGYPNLRRTHSLMKHEKGLVQGYSQLGAIDLRSETTCNTKISGQSLMGFSIVGRSIATLLSLLIRAKTRTCTPQSGSHPFPSRNLSYFSGHFYRHNLSFRLFAFLQISLASEMEFELVDDASSPSANPGLPKKRKFHKDEAVLARFGKRQQLRVSTSM